MARTYHVLRQNNDADLEAYDYLGRIEASNPEQAIRLTAVDEGTGRYVAVPDGNWTSIGVRVEIPAPRVIFENEPVSDIRDSEISEPIDLSDAQIEKLADPEYLERKAELAARRAGQ